MSWNGKSVNYDVTPDVRRRHVQELLSVPKFVNDIYNEIREKNITNKNNIIEIRSSEYAKLPYSWKKKKRLFGVDVRINDSMNVDYRILPLSSVLEHDILG